ncbi:MAG: hypothetical protein H7123_08960, partial [Thermoleophilia bacterium]|nr:hypothetical protein [Thermoleophilia bacterium]
MTILRLGEGASALPAACDCGHVELAGSDDDAPTTDAQPGAGRGRCVDAHAAASARLRAVHGGGSTGAAAADTAAAANSRAQARRIAHAHAHAATVADLLTHSHADPTLTSHATSTAVHRHALDAHGLDHRHDRGPSHADGAAARTSSGHAMAAHDVEALAAFAESLITSGREHLLSADGAESNADVASQAARFQRRSLDQSQVRELLLAVDAAVDDSRQLSERAALPSFLPHAAGDFEYLALPRELFIVRE